MDGATFIAVRRSIARGWFVLREHRECRMDALGAAVALLLLQVLLVTLAGTWAMPAVLFARFPAHVEVIRGVSDQRVQELFASLRGLPYARDVAYLPREQVFLEERERDPSLATFLEKYDIDNPFSDTFVVTLGDHAGYAVLRSFVQGESWQGVIDAATLSQIATQEHAAAELLDVIDAAQTGTLLLVLIAAFAAAVAAVTLSVRLARSRREDARLQQLSGASQGLAAAPSRFAAGMLLLGALLLSMLATAVLVGILSFFPASDLVRVFFSQTLLSSLTTFCAFAFLEIAALLALAWGASRT